MRDGEATSLEGVGLGTDAVFTADGFVASALVWDEAVVHLAMFANAPLARHTRASAIASPRQRSHTWFRDEHTGAGGAEGS